LRQARRETSRTGDCRELKRLIPKMEKVHDITRRHELLGEKVPNSEKIFSIYEAHTDIIVRAGGKRNSA